MDGAGEMPEGLKGHDWKSCVPTKSEPRVRIPLSPPSYAKASDGKPDSLANEARRAQLAAEASFDKPILFHKEASL